MTETNVLGVIDHTCIDRFAIKWDHEYHVRQRLYILQKKVGAGRPSMSETKALPTVPVVHKTRCQLCEIAIVTSVRASFHGICKMVIPCRIGDQTISVSN